MVENDWLSRSCPSSEQYLNDTSADFQQYRRQCPILACGVDNAAWSNLVIWLVAPNRTALETHRGKRQPPLSNVHTLPRVLVHPTELWGTALSRTRVRTWLWSSAATRHPHSHALQLWAFATDPDSATRATPRADGKATTAAQSVPTMVKTGD